MNRRQELCSETEETLLRKNNFGWREILLTVVVLFLSAGHVHAGNFGAGVHSGYGVIRYEEATSAIGAKIESEASMDAFLFGVSGEYSFAGPKNLFAGIVTDWALGLEDNETWKENGVKIQTNDLSVFGQFYDIRLGYKNSLDRFYYRAYLSGGWDGIHFRRKNFALNGSVFRDVITEDFSLWRGGAGIGLGYKFGKWAVDGRAAYAYYFDGEVRNSSHPGLVFDTNGICFDAGLGVARELTKNISLYLGGSYTLIDLDESEVNQQITQHGNIITRQDIVFPDSRTQILSGIVNVTYHF